MRVDSRLFHSVHGTGFCVSLFANARVQELYCYTPLLRASEFECLLHAAIERDDMMVRRSHD